MITDPISDMLIRIKNASRVGHESVTVPFSEFKCAIAELLVREGYLTSTTKRGKKVRKSLALGIAYKGSTVPMLTNVKRISKPSRRIYKKSSDIRSVKNGYGALILSPSQGIMSGREARRASLGGEALFQIW